MTILDDLMRKDCEIGGEVLPDVNVLGALPSPDDVVAPFNTRRVVFVHWGGLLLRKPHLVE